MFLFVLIVCLPLLPLLDSEFHEGRRFCLIFFTKYPKSLEQCLTHSRCSISIVE